MVAPDGEIDRGALATVVFDDREALAWLEELLHPLVSLEYLQWRDQLAELPQAPTVSVTEVPLLYETGGDARFDTYPANKALKKKRTGSRSSWSMNRPSPFLGSSTASLCLTDKWLPREHWTKKASLA